MNEQLEKISYESLHTIAYDKIVEALRGGKFQPGDSLRTRTLAKALGISPTPVREALSRLIAQNALEVDPRNRTAIVPRLTKELLDEMYELRDLLDGLAAEAAAKNITDKEVKHLKKLAEELEKLDADNDAEEFLNKSEDFFFTIFRAARRPLLLEILDSLWLRSSVILGLTSRSRPADFTIADARSQMVKGLAKRDPTMTRKGMELALEKTRDMVFAALEAENGKSGT